MADADQTKASEKRSTRQIIWGALVDLRAQGQIATRQVLTEITGLKLVTVDDHIHRMVEDGHLRRPVAGVVEIVDQMPPPRPLSITDLPDGMTIVELGDDMLRMWPQERRAFAKRMAGDVVQFSNIEYGRETSVAMAEMLAEVRKLQRANKALEAELKKLQGQGQCTQMDLLKEPAPQ